jgi:transcriptional regulator with XRE-family HTH domain
MAIDYAIMGEKLKIARKNKKLTQEQLAEQIDVSVAYLSRIERGDIKINLPRLSQICDLLDVSLSYVLTNETNSSETYLNDDFLNLLKSCPPEKSKLIYEIAKLIIKEK